MNYYLRNGDYNYNIIKYVLKQINEPQPKQQINWSLSSLKKQRNTLDMLNIWHGPIETHSSFTGNKMPVSVSQSLSR